MTIITVQSTDDKPIGEITKFEVTARCPHCENDTSVSLDEARRLHVQCQHCDEEFQIYLAD